MCYPELHTLYFARYTLVLKVETPMVMPPFKGATFRGGLGHALRQVLRDLRDHETYVRLFEPVEPDVARRHRLRMGQHVPRPYILHPPSETTTAYEPGQTLMFGLTLIGNMIAAFPRFLMALDKLGRELGLGKGRTEGQGRFSIVGMQGPLTAADYQRAADLLQPAPSQTRLHLIFHTPTRVRVRTKTRARRLLLPEQGRDFMLLTHALHRRLGLLTALYCDPVDRTPVRRLAQENAVPHLAYNGLQWHEWTRYSQRQKKTIRMGGFVGEATFEGAIAPYVPLLRLGEPLHMGTGTAFGLGHFGLRTTA